MFLEVGRRAAQDTPVGCEATRDQAGIRQARDADGDVTAKDPLGRIAWFEQRVATAVALGKKQGKTVIVVLSRGGVYSTSEGGRAMEHQETYLQTIFGFFGITDVRFVRAEGVGMGPEAKAKGLATAENEIRAHVAQATNQPALAQVA